ncbi:DODA-type extradiol aromatic ring-opening family dioxygenase [Lacibacterium aquatile]|uniref:DODA-type extradiol aromatic ring-opening family dioxygenase n=1 Tax=Lacibacterium aquatile TaxID=1168082 RepID=A0ABW5DRZ3_9PROT
MVAMPTLFVSHGSPMMPLEDIPAKRFLAGLATTLPRPTAILSVSAHWETETPEVSAVAQPETIHDFYGFPPALYALQYPAPGAPALAQRVAELTGAAIDPIRGLDHGAWTPLLLAYPDADVPVTQVSIQPHAGPAHQYALGEALRPLRDEGVLIVASGGISHNLREWFRGAPGSGPRPWMSEFTEWMAEHLETRDDEAVIDYRQRAPHAAQNHPRDEHFQPLHVALGAATPGVAGKRIHQSHDMFGVPMDTYMFA